MTSQSLKVCLVNNLNPDVRGNKAGRYAIAQSKVLVPIECAKIIDECMQLHGGQGLTQHTPLPEMWTYARFVRIADGPDAAHRHQVGRDEIKGARRLRERHEAYRERYRELCGRWGVEEETFGMSKGGDGGSEKAGIMRMN